MNPDAPDDGRVGTTPPPPQDAPLHAYRTNDERRFGRGTVVAAALGGMVVGASVVALALSLGEAAPAGDAADAEQGAPAFATAYGDCGPSDGLELVDDGTTLALDVQGEEDFGGASYTTVDCVLGALETPSRITELMNSTRALDGRQAGTWDGISATWSYHPDTGLDLLLTVEPAGDPT
ncbi:hypothetical protein M1843_00990 [Isoptericola sp. 4D.3]|uniref:Uncharacterized protein n=1 Tax=Isoptericola peretonis TaxID=2918523 RepID=A0ABT0IYJ5_9MICO|nr:hypothetical protein [Isoptericola sp. 4D.3]